MLHHTFLVTKIPYRLDIYELLNRTSSEIVRVAAASGLAQGFRIVLSPKVKIKNSTSSVYSSLYGIAFISFQSWSFEKMTFKVYCYALVSTITV